MKCIIFMWAVLYNIVYLAGKYSNSSVLAVLIMSAYIFLFAVWIYKKNLHIYTGFTVKDIKWDKAVSMVPLLILPVYNLIAADNRNFTLYSIAMIFAAAVAEEIFFRGFIRNGLKRNGLLFSVVFTNILFAVYHLSNMLGGADIRYVAMQMFAAFTVGMAYSMTAEVHKSILPCIAAHFMTNITGAVREIQSIGAYRAMFIISVFYLIYDFYLITDNKTIFIESKKQ